MQEGIMALRRLVLVVLVCACALALGRSASAGTQLRPVDGDVAGLTPLFEASLTADDNHPKVLVARAEDAAAGRLDAAGSCDLQPAGGGDASRYACRLPAPLPPGSYAWTLQTDYLFCDGDAGQYCDWTPRQAGPAPFTVSATTAPAPAAVRQLDPPTIVPGLAIGGVRLGMTEQQVADAYGAATGRGASSARKRARVGANYELHGGLLQVVYLEGRVVSISTTSPYYRTPSGLAVGLRPTRASLRGFRSCGGYLALATPTGGETQVVVTAKKVVAVRVDAAPSAC
jgi:hypothetical protein